MIVIALRLLFSPRQVKLSSLLQDPKGCQQAKSPVYGERQVVIQYKVRALPWRPAGRLVRFVAVIHPTRGSCLLMCTDTSLAAIEIVRLYGLRFKIEHTFKQAVRLIGSFSYHFWMSDMEPLRRRSGNQHLHRASPGYRDAVRRKALIVKTPAPLADNLTRCVEMFRDAGVPETLDSPAVTIFARTTSRYGDAYSLDRASSCARSPLVRWITYGLLIGMTHPPGEDDPVMTAQSRSKNASPYL